MVRQRFAKPLYAGSNPVLASDEFAPIEANARYPAARVEVSTARMLAHNASVRAATNSCG